MRPTEWYRGQVKLGDHEYEAALLDMRMDGLTGSDQDLLLLDLNQDGVFECDFSTFRLECAANDDLRGFSAPIYVNW